MTEITERLKTAIADRYRIERELGQGGMAIVYLAEDLKHRRKVAVKVLRPELAEAIGGDRFLREIEVAAQLQHPHILPLYDSGESDTFLYYVMPFVEGESLRDKLVREKQLPIDEAVRLAAEVADALSDAHQHGVIHRDIKPENILLSGRHAVVTDFGIARAVSAAGGERLTQTGLTMGTPAYMSPEQAAGDQEVDGRSDVYALGCVLFEMLAGEPPFTGPTAQVVISKRFTDPLPKIGSIRDTVPDALDLVITRAMAKIPADRFASAGEMHRALLGLGGAQTAASAPTVPVSTSRPKQRFGMIALGSAGVIAVAALAFALLRSPGSEPSAGENGRPMLVVLPFQNLGSPDDEYFANGITEEITSRLAQISGLGVVSRQSAMQYKASTKALREIGEELGVQYVLEGTIRTERVPGGTGQVRVTPQLIRVSDDTHLWADRYTADLVPGELFAIQSTIAEQVASALGVTLLGSERQDVASSPTENLEAYEAYLRGVEQWRRGYDEADMRAAEVELRQAVSLDPEFALAHAALSHVHNNLFWFSYDVSPTRAALSRAAAERSLAIDSTLPEAHIAMGEYLYHGERDYDGALRELAIALPRRPNNAELYRTIAAVKRRQGEWEDALVSFRKVADELDPRSAIGHWETSATAMTMRRYELAAEYLQRAMRVDSTRAENYVSMAQLVLLESGDSARAREWLDDGARQSGPEALISGFAAQLVGPSLTYASPTLRAALLALPRSAYDVPVNYDFFRGLLFVARGDSVGARASFDSARTTLEGLVTQGTAQYQAGLVYPQLAQTYAYLGRGADAVSAARRALDLMPVEKDALIGNGSRLVLASVYATLGRADEAVAELDELLRVPSSVSRASLRVDPVWQSIRRHPAFQRLLEREPQAGSREP